MFISVQLLQKQELTFDEQLRPGALDLGPEITQCGPFHVTGQADLVVEHEGGHSVNDIRLRGHFDTRFAVQCARCLEPLEQDLAGDFDLLYRPLGATQRPPESSISTAETEIGFYRGEGLQLEQVMAEQVLLAVPIRSLCRSDCKGLCPHCGRNLNAGPCQCPPPAPDARWGGLEQLRERLKK